MPRKKARFRISIKDIERGDCFRVELIPNNGVWGERRFSVRVNGKLSTKVETVTLTQIFHRLRRWLVKRAEAD